MLEKDDFNDDFNIQAFGSLDHRNFRVQVKYNIVYKVKKIGEKVK